MGSQENCQGFRFRTRSDPKHVVLDLYSSLVGLLHSPTLGTGALINASLEKRLDYKKII